MPKYSIVIPVYNVEKYIKRCIESIFNQTFKDFEIIAVNDGCTDSSIDIIKKYDVKIINLKHVSVSEARNIGAKKATGEYLIFLDSDDFWDERLLEKIEKSTKNHPDLVRFQARTITDNNEITDFSEEEFTDLNGEEAFDRIVKYHFVENVWCYAIKREYYRKNKFTFKIGTVHEDFGLTPLIVIKANKVNCINYIGYNYYRRKGSIMNKKDYEWTKKKVDDFYDHYKFLMSEIKKVKVNKTIFESYCTNSVLLKICELKGKDYRKYKKILRKENVFNYLLNDTVGRKIKKILYIISPKFVSKITK